MTPIYLKAWDSKTFSDFKVSAAIDLNPTTFEAQISIAVSGPLQNLKGIPSQNQLSSPVIRTRHETLWKSTCLEVFVGLEGQSEYWEWNFAPDLSAYAAFYFSVERQREVSLWEHSPQAMPFDVSFVRVNDGEVHWKFHLDFKSWSLICWKKDLGTNTSGEHPIRVGLNAILENQTGEQSFWALEHGNPSRADFHGLSNRALKI